MSHGHLICSLCSTYLNNAPVAQRLAYFLDTEGVTGSNPVRSTLERYVNNGPRCPGSNAPPRRQHKLRVRQSERVFLLEDEPGWYLDHAGNMCVEQSISFEYYFFRTTHIQGTRCWPVPDSDSLAFGYVNGPPT